MHRVALLFTILASCTFSGARAEEQTNIDFDRLRSEGYSVRTITPIFSQLLMLSFPKGFEPAFENANRDDYVQESVLAGETVDEWSQMITVTGARGLATNPNASPQAMLEGISAGFKRACPETFSFKSGGTQKISGYGGYLAFVACGTVRSSAKKHSESALLVAIKGSADYYTIQWAERASTSNQSIVIDEGKWANRFKQLNPIKLCPRVAGETSPYPSCSGQK